MALTLTLADAVLKEDYKGPLRKQINDMVILSAQVSKNTEDLVGRRAILPLHVSRNTGVGSRLEGEVIPTAGNQGTVDQIVNLRSHYGRIKLTRQVITRMEKDRGAFVRAIKFEMDGLSSDCGRDYNRQLWGTSDGIIAQCGTTTAANVVVLAAATAEQVIVNLGEGMLVDIGTTANPQSVATARSVTAVDFTNKTVTIDGAAVTTNNTHFITRNGAGNIGGNQRELTGVQTIVKDTGTLFGVNPATYWQWASIVDSNAGTSRPLTENLVSRLIMRSRNRSGKEPSALYAEGGVVRHAVATLQAKQRIVNTIELKGGFKAIGYAVGGTELALVEERDAPVSTLWGLAHSELVEFIDEDWQWEDLDGSVLQRATDGTHQFEAYYYKFSEFATTRRNAHFLISDLDTA